MPDVWVLSEWVTAENGDRVWSVVSDYPGEWSDMVGQADTDILDAGYDRCVLRGRVTVDQEAALQADNRYSTLPVSGSLTAEQIATLQGGVAAALSSDVAALVTEATTDADTIAARMVEANRRPLWKPDLNVTADEVYYHEGNLYEVIQPHTTQADWPPNIVPALFKRYHEPSDDPWPWMQPTGAHDSYPAGARVLHNGAVWVSAIDANVWEPGSVGAENLWTMESGGEPAPDCPTWVQPTGAHDAYNIGDCVTFEGNLYESAIDANVWSPTVHPAGWTLIGPA